MSKRSGKPFVAVDCGLLSKELAASALFGHEKGAFTGAENNRKGYWEEADGGTLFLDEIGNLPPEVQQMMLRALETKRYRPVGGNREKAADVRIIAATNEDMQSAVAEKRFRQDLFHRIKEYMLNIPPLRECREYIMPLADFFRELANKEFGKQVKGFDAEARKRMLVHPWSGNVRELKGTVRSAVLFTDGDTITVDKLNFEEPLLSGETSLSLKNVEMEKKQIIRALEQANGNRSLAALLLGIGRTTLYNKMKEYGIKYKGVTQNIPCCCHFSAVTEKPSGNSKDTLLISREISNPSANGLEFVLLFSSLKHRFPMPKLPKRRKGIGWCVSLHLIEITWNKTGFSSF